MSKPKIHFLTLFVLIITSFFSLPISSVYGHGLGLDTTSIDVEGKKISVSVEIPTMLL